jgi:hypothetical protein
VGPACRDSLEAAATARDEGRTGVSGLAEAKTVLPTSEWAPPQTAEGARVTACAPAHYGTAHPRAAVAHTWRRSSSTSASTFSSGMLQ